LKAGEWFRRGLLLIISPVWQPFWPPSGRNSTYPTVQISRASSFPSDALDHETLDLLQPDASASIFALIQQIRSHYLRSQIDEYIGYAAIANTALLLKSNETRWLEFQRSAAEYYRVNDIIGWPPKPGDSADALKFVAKCVLLPTEDNGTKKTNKIIKALEVLIDQCDTPESMVAALVERGGIAGFYAQRTKRNKHAEGQRAQSSDPTSSRSEPVQLSTIENQEELIRNRHSGPQPFRVTLEITSLDRFTRYAFQRGGSVFVQLKQPSRSRTGERVGRVVPGRILNCE
jgi:hypothetical protein